MTTQLIPQNTYNFDTLAPAVLGARYKNAVLLGISSYELAVAQPNENLDLKYRQVFPALPQGTPDSPRKQRYFIFRTELGTRVTMCEQWINQDSIELVSSIDFTVKFSGAQSEDMNRIRQLLVAAGYSNFKIE